MCGICGIYHIDNRPVSEETVNAMNSTMIHRGPDGYGLFVDQNIGLGHRRLSIIDLDSGSQPMSSSDGQITIVFNGEIYNFIELKELLQSKGYRFSTKSDTETIIYSYMEWGDEFVKKLRGMFAIALWDNSLKKLLLVRDRVGKKPLYYFYDGKTLAFASELKAILTIPEISKEINYKALDSYFSFGYVPSPLTIFRHIKKLEPAHYAVCSNGGFKINGYWDLNMDSSDNIMSEEDAIGELTTIFDESVKLRLISDVPLGAFLSGGVDSSAVVASMAGIMGTSPVKTCSIGFSEKKFNELAFAEIVSQQYRTDHRESVVTPDAVDIIQKIVWHFDEPFADSSAIPTWYVSKITRENVTVALSGDGGDENFAGYTQRYSMNRFEHNIREKIPPVLRKSVLAPIAAIYPRVDALPRPLRLKHFLTNLSLPMERAYFRDMSFYFTEDAKELLYSPNMKKELKGYSSFDVLNRFFKKTRTSDPVSRVQYVDIKTYMTEDILVKVDRMSMAHSLEVRSPILDHKLMEFAAKLPSRLKLNGKESKYIFKKMNEKRLPHDILYRKKQGFSVPLSDWLKGKLRLFAEETLFSKQSGVGEFVNKEYVELLWKSHLKGFNDNSSKIWNLMMFELWRKNFL